MRPSEMILTLEKEGLLTVTGSSRTQCRQEGTQAYEYKLEITCSGDQVSPDTGWLVKVEDLDEVLQGMWADSCEMMSMSLCELLKEWLEGRGISPLTISFTLKGASGGRMTARWVNVHETMKEAPAYV